MILQSIKESKGPVSSLDSGVLGAPIISPATPDTDKLFGACFRLNWEIPFGGAEGGAVGESYASASSFCLPLPMNPRCLEMGASDCSREANPKSSGRAAVLIYDAAVLGVCGMLAGNATTDWAPRR